MSHARLNGVSSFISGYKLIWLPTVRWLVIIPLVINFLLFVALFKAGAALAENAIHYVMGWLPDWLSFLDWLFWLLYGVFFLLVFAYCFVSVANLIGAPFYAIVAERIEKHLLGKRSSSDGKALMAVMFESVGREIQKVLYYLPRAVFLLILGLIPGLNLLGAILGFVFSAWMMALQYTDYSADNQGLNFTSLRDRLRYARFSSFTFGALVSIAHMIPLLNLVAVPASVCGGAHFWWQMQTRKEKMEAIENCAVE